MQFDPAEPEYHRALQDARAEAYNLAVQDMVSAEKRAQFALSVLSAAGGHLPPRTGDLCLAAIDTYLTPPTTTQS